MKVKVPTSAYLLGSVNEWTLNPISGELTYRIAYYALSDGESEVDACGTFMGVRGPRFSLKPVYHVKPVGQTDYGLYVTGGRTIETHMGGNYLGSAIRSKPGCTVVVLSVGDYQTTNPTSVLDRLRVDIDFWYIFNGRDGKRYGDRFSAVFYLYANGGISQSRRTSVYTKPLIDELLRRLGMSWRFCRYLGLKRSDYAESQADARLKITKELYKFVDEVFDIWTELTADLNWPSLTSIYPFPASAVNAYESVATVDLFHDKDRFIGDPVIDTSNYWVEYGKQHAFVEAVQSVPRMNENSLSNLKEFASFLYSLIVRREISIPNSLSDAWLSYRYVYNTTKMDAEQAVSFMRRHADKFLSGLGLRSYGRKTFEYEGHSVTVRCSVHLRNRALDTIGKVWRTLDTYGLKPNLYILWDMIPYSFIVDWFLPVGDVLSVSDVRQRVAEYYDFYGITYSISYEFLQDGIRWKSYRRWVESAPPDLSGIYWLENGNVSPKLAIYRALDSASLILG
jgi:hypothetical protein